MFRDSEERKSENEYGLRQGLQIGVEPEETKDYLEPEQQGQQGQLRQEEPQEQEEELKQKFYFSRHLLSCNNIIDTYMGNSVLYVGYKVAEPLLSLWGLLTGLMTRKNVVNYQGQPIDLEGTTQRINKVYVSCLLRTWLTAILKYLPYSDESKPFVLVVSPYIKEYHASKLDGSNLPPRNFQIQLDKFYAFFDILLKIEFPKKPEIYNKKKKRILDRLHTIRLNFPLFNNFELDLYERKKVDNLSYYTAFDHSKITVDRKPYDQIHASKFNADYIKESIKNIERISTDNNKELLIIQPNDRESIRDTEVFRDATTTNPNPNGRESFFKPNGRESFGIAPYKYSGGWKTRKTTSQKGGLYRKHSATLNRKDSQRLETSKEEVEFDLYHQEPKYPLYYETDGLILFTNWVQNVIQDKSPMIYVVAHNDIMQQFLLRLCNQIDNDRDSRDKFSNKRDILQCLRPIVGDHPEHFFHTNMWDIIYTVNGNNGEKMILKDFIIKIGEEPPDRTMINLPAERLATCPWKLFGGKSRRKKRMSRKRKV
jgi:hypothetical protein